jgi:BirA family biotin operon repressor/biotin-[acetyl-CoA-carboxylase] ligase
MSASSLEKHPTETRVGWTYHVFPELESTNSFAGKLAPWTAVRAEVQTAGRGRTPDRHWASGHGGLWLSAVLPCPGARCDWQTLPLTAGWAVVNALRALGATKARLRWPNDVMVDGEKLAGLLVERYTDETAVVGIGLNVFNHPSLDDPALAGKATELRRFVCGDFTLDDIADCLLTALRDAHETVIKFGFGGIAAELNRTWGEPRRVEITYSGATAPVRCVFHGVDKHGRLRVTTPDDALHAYDATEIALFRELT